MASGSFKTGWGQYTKTYDLIVEWSSAANIAANTSTVTAVIKFYCPYTCDMGQRYSNIVTINGVQYMYDSPAINTKGGETITLATIRSNPIAHNADGSKSVAISAQFRFNASLSGVQYGIQTASNTVALDNIPRAATLTAAPNFNDIDNPTISYSNPAGNAVTELKACISFDGSADDIPFRDIPKTGTSYTFTLTDAERQKIYAKTPNAKSLSVVFSLATNIGGQWHYSKLWRTVNIVNAEPSVNPEIYDADESIVALTHSNKSLIPNYSDIYYNLNAVAKKGATIKSYKVWDNENTKTTATGTFTNIKGWKVNYEVIDSRGNKTTGSTTQSTIIYKELSCSIKGELTTDGVLTMNMNGDFWFGFFGYIANSIKLEYRIKSDNVWGNWVRVNETTAEIASSNTHTYAATVIKEGLDYRKTYTIQARATDALNVVYSTEQTILSYPLFDWGANDFNFNVPVSFNGVPMTDFIVEQGFSNDWFYRKWNSGIGECWRLYYGKVNASQTNYNGYYYSPTITVPYPFTFTNYPCLQANGGSSANMNFVRVFGQYEDAASFVVCGHAADATNTDITVNLYAIGKWK